MFVLHMFALLFHHAYIVVSSMLGSFMCGVTQMLVSSSYVVSLCKHFETSHKQAEAKAAEGQGFALQPPPCSSTPVPQDVMYFLNFNCS